MNRQNIRAKEKTGIRKDSFAVIGILAYIGSLIFRVLLYHVIGEKGVGYFGIASELYVILSFFFSYGLSEAVTVLVRYRLKREQFRNAGKVLYGGLLLALVLGGILSVIFLFGGQFFADTLVSEPLAGLAVTLMAPALLFSLLTGVLRGYFQGNGSRIPSMHSKILETVFLIVGGLLGAGILQGYGEKVSALLQNEDYAAAYGAMGASIGFLTASVFCFLHLLLLFFIYRKKVQEQVLRDTQKNQEKSGYIIRMLAGTAAPYAVYAFIFHCLPLLDGCLFFHFSGENANAAMLWGNYYGKYMILPGIISSLISLTTLEPVRRIIILTDKEEYRTAREKIGFLIHQMALLTVPAAVFTAVFSENLLNLLFKGNNLKTAQWLAVGSVGIVVYVFAVLFMNMLVRLKKMNYVIACGTMAVLLHVIAVILLLQKAKLAVMALVIGSLIFYLLLTAAGFWLICRSFQYTQEWIKSIAFTVVAAGIGGLICMLLNKALVPVTGSTISLFICLPVGIVVYIILLLVIKGVGEREMENIWGGGVLRTIAQRLHLM